MGLNPSSVSGVNRTFEGLPGWVGEGARLVEETENRQDRGNEQLRKIVLALLFALLLAAFYNICRPFLPALCWACVVVLGAWPIHSRIRERMPRWPAAASLLTTLILALCLLGITIPVVKGLGPEIKTAGNGVIEFVSTRQELIRGWISRVPLVGENLALTVPELKQRAADLIPLAQEYSKTLFGTASTAAQGVFSFLFQVGVFCLAVFFLLYHGERFAQQVRTALLRMDSRTERFLTLVQRTVTGVLYGLVFTALAQGILAGLGFAVAGVRAPTVLGLATVFLSFVPYGPQLVYVPVALTLALSGSLVAGVLLALWGFLVVSSADNVLKPYFISRQVRLPLPLALIGVVGGLLHFGLIGVFLGPVVVGLVQVLWLDWTEEQVPEERVPSENEFDPAEEEGGSEEPSGE